MNIIVMVVLGRLLVWMIQTSGPTRKFLGWHPLLIELRACDFCIGCWVFPILAWVFGVNLLDPIYHPVFCEIVTGFIFSFAVHLGSIGWRDKWGYEEIIGPSDEASYGREETTGREEMTGREETTQGKDQQ